MPKDIQSEFVNNLDLATFSVYCPRITGMALGTQSQ